MYGNTFEADCPPGTELSGPVALLPIDTDGVGPFEEWMVEWMDNWFLTTHCEQDRLVRDAISKVLQAGERNSDHNCIATEALEGER
jgi:hypothetical protein